MKFLSVEEACKYLGTLSSKGFALICVGTYVRSDDRAALELCTKILERKALNTEVILCEHGLEMCIHEVIEKKLSKAVIIDAFATPSFSKSIAIINPEEVADHVLLSTHAIPLETTLNYLRSSLGEIEIVILGIPVKNLEIGLDISEEVNELIDNLVKCLDK